MVGNALQHFLEDIGIPNEIVVNGSKEQTGPQSDFMKLVRKCHIKIRCTEPYTPRQNKSELTIGNLKRRWRNLMSTHNISPRFWDFGLLYESEIMSRMARGPDCRSAYERITGNTPDISEWLDFEFYALVWYWDEPYSKDDTKKATIGRWLGVSHHVGSNMCFWILMAKCQIISRTTVQHVTVLERQTTEMQDKIRTYDTMVQERLQSPAFVPTEQGNDIFYIEDEPESEPVEPGVPDVDDITPDTYDEFLNTKLMVPTGGTLVPGRVTKRARGDDGQLHGKRHTNPLLDTRSYVVRLSDGSELELAANILAENICSMRL